MIPDVKNNAHIIIANTLSKLQVIVVFIAQTNNILKYLQKNVLPLALTVKYLIIYFAIVLLKINSNINECYA